MHQRIIVRSLTTGDGTLVAMNDGTLVLETKRWSPLTHPASGLPTVLLALRGPMGPVDAVAVGTADAGGAVVLTIPRFETVFSLEIRKRPGHHA